MTKLKAILATTLMVALVGTVLVGCKTETNREKQMQGKPMLLEEKQGKSSESEKVEMKTDNSKSTGEIFTGTQNERAVKLLSILVSEDITKNVMISPISIESLLGMVANGMSDGGPGREAIEGFTGHEVELLNSENKEYMQSVNNDILKIANSIWVKQGLTEEVSKVFKQTLKDNYDAEIENFGNSAYPINKWVKDKTNGMIPEIISEIDPDLRMVLLNAVYFKGTWREPFKTSNTEREYKFNINDKESVNCEMMVGKADYYMENSQVTAFSKQYDGGYTFIGMLPKDANNFKLENLSIDSLLETSSNNYDILVRIPKFELEYGRTLTDAIKSLGMAEIFNGSAMSEIGIDAGLSDIIHKTAIKMNEEGTEASAVTGGMIRSVSVELPKKQVEINLDRPFIYAIRDKNKTMFIGIVNNPIGG